MNTITSIEILEPIDALGERIAEAEAQLDSGLHPQLVDIREFDELGGWHRQGAKSCAHWLSWRCGLDLDTAREKVRVANALAKLPAIGETLRRAEVSYSKVRAITRVANADNEAALLDFARHSTTSQLEQLCRRYRQVQPAEPGVAPVPERYLRARETDDGMVRLTVKLTPEEAALVFKACEHPSAEGCSRVDGLVAMAEAALRGSVPARPPVEVVVHVDADSLTGNLPDGSGLSAESARRLLCDAGIVPVLEDGSGKTLDIGRKSRTIPAALRRALQIRDGGCRFPGCSHRIVDAHHVVHWADGGETKLSNTMLVCRRHHVLLHEGGFSMTGSPDGELAFFNPDGARIPNICAPTKLVAFGANPLRDASTTRGLDITSETNRPFWDGSTPDYSMALDSLFPSPFAN